MTRFIAYITVLLALVSGCAPAPFTTTADLPAAEDTIEGVFGSSPTDSENAQASDDQSESPKLYRLAAIAASVRETEAKSADRNVRQQESSVDEPKNEMQDRAELEAGEISAEATTVAGDDTDGASDARPTPTPVIVRETPRLWMDMSMGVELIDWFNESAFPTDIARADHVSRIDMLEQIEVGRRLVIFRNVADAEALLPRLHDKIDVIGYNLEHGPANRDDRNDPVGSVRRMRALADEYGLELALGPDREFAVNNGVEMAPYVDIFVLQIQKVQTEPATVQDFVLPLSAQFRAVNPDIEISVQVRTEGDPVQIADLIFSLGNSIDAFSILTSPESVAIAEALVDELRPEIVIMPMPTPTPTPQGAKSPAPVSRNAQAMLVPTPTISPRKLHAATVVPSTPTNAHQVGAAATSNVMILAGLAGFGVLVSGLMATVVLYVVQKLRIR